MVRLVVFLGLLVSSVARAGLEVEVDPIAYLSKSYSGHILYDTGWGVRIDLGAFGMEMPEFAEPNEGFKTKFTGYGVKLQYYGKSTDGTFVGVSYGTSRFNVEHEMTKATGEVDLRSAGVQIGYRFGKEGFYVTPWIGFDKILGDRKIDVGGKAYEFPEISVFPTVHLGYRF